MYMYMYMYTLAHIYIYMSVYIYMYIYVYESWSSWSYVVFLIVQLLWVVALFGPRGFGSLLIGRSGHYLEHPKLI